VYTSFENGVLLGSWSIKNVLPTVAPELRYDRSAWLNLSSRYARAGRRI
jgi:hypothetical protein